MKKVDHITEFLTSVEYKKPVQAFVGIDPAIGCTGYNLLLVDANGTKYSVDSGTFKTKPKESKTVRLTKLHEFFCDYLGSVSSLLKYYNIPIISIGMEVPAVFLKKERFSRDLTQRDAVTACRIAAGRLGLFIFGDEFDKPIRPQQVHSLGGANKKGVGVGLTGKKKSDLKKSMVKDALESCCVIYYPISNYDESDALACSVIASQDCASKTK